MVRITGLIKRFQAGREEVRAVQAISFEVPEGSFYTLLGPSGCGKTTTLRCIAGLERPEGGEISIDGVIVSSPKSGSGVFVPPNKRNIGMVFQSYAIWPHLTVFENVAFPLRVGKSRCSSTQIRAKVSRALEIVRLGGLEDRPAPQLSGGQQQRLALARALVGEPRLLLLDEPLSNLDAKLRESMRVELREIQQQLGITAIYVTHDQAEALSMSNVIAVMHDGRIVQEGAPRDIYERPNSRFVADFIGSANLISGHLVEENVEGESCTVRSSIGTLRSYCPIEIGKGSEVLISARPENVKLHMDKPEKISNIFEGTVTAASFLGERVDCQVQIGNQMILVRQHPSVKVGKGDRVYVELPVDDCIVVPSEGNASATAGSAKQETRPAVRAFETEDSRVPSSS